MRRDPRFTRATLTASEDHGGDAQPIEGLLTEWSALDAVRFGA
jgi:hypothetical protein